MNIRFKVDGSTLGSILTWEDAEIIDARNMARMRQVVAKFLVDDAGNEVRHEAAMKILGALTWNEMNDVITRFFEAFADAKISPTTGVSSNVPSPAAVTHPSGGNS